MLLGGLWHGAGWTFIIWGGLHGFYLIINHQWRNLKQRLNWSNGGMWSNLAAGMLTFLAVVVGWVFFRADSFSSAIIMLQGMSGMNGVSLPASLETWWNRYMDYLPTQGWLVFKGLHSLKEGVSAFHAWITITLGMLIIFKSPNVQQITLYTKPSFNIDPIDNKNTVIYMVKWKPTLSWAITTGILLFTSIVFMNAPSEFLYFQF
jgi:alginate O-acetyltransferase complex protein AlgI